MIKKENLKKWKSHPQLVTLVFFILGVLAIIPWIRSDSSQPPPEPASVDTYIPQGQVLVPLEIANLESLNSFLGAMGIVDLYESNTNGSQGRKIASRIKVIRAPLNPQLFAALVPEASGPELLKAKAPLWAVVQNKGENPGGLQARQSLREFRVNYHNGSSQ